MESKNSSIVSLNKLKLDQHSGFGSRNRIYGNSNELKVSLKAKETEFVNTTAQSVEPRDKTYSRKQRILLTICVYLSFYSLGMLCNVLGPTLVHISYLLGVDMASISLAFTFEWCGYLVGSLICGTTYDLFNEELQFSVFTFLMGATIIMCPWAQSVHWFYAFKAIQAVTMGYVDVMSHAYIISIWNGHRLKQTMHQIMMTVYSIGATTGPLFIAPFLVDLPNDDASHDNGDEEEVTYANLTLSVSNSEHISNNSETSVQYLPGIENVRYSYTVVGCIAIVWSLFFAIAFFALTPSCRRAKHRRHKSEVDNNLAKEDKKFNYTMLVIIFWITTFHTFIIIPGWISSFVIKGLLWESKKGPLITSVYWFSNLFGRIVAIPVSMVLSPGKMVTCNMAGTAVSLILTIAVAFLKPELLWLTIALVGFTLATTFGTTVLWTSQHINITGTVSSVLISGFSVGFMSAGALAGYLFQRYSAFWVLYISLIAGFLQICLFACANVLVKCYPKHKRDSLELTIGD